MEAATRRSLASSATSDRPRLEGAYTLVSLHYPEVTTCNVPFRLNLTQLSYGRSAKASSPPCLMGADPFLRSIS
jgi:hypothetical protein